MPRTAQAQLSLTLSNNVGNAVTETNYGRQVSFSMNLLTNNGPSQDTQIVVTVPPGVTFLSASSGISAAQNGTQITLGLGAVQAAFLVNFLTLNISNTIPDGTPLQASFQASGHLSGSAQIVTSNVVTALFEGGYSPVGVYVQTEDAACNVSATNSDNSFTRSSGGGGGATSTFNPTTGGMPGFAEGQAGGAPATLTEVGQVTGPNSMVAAQRAASASGSAQGGFALFACPPVICGIPLPASVSCGVTAQFSFSNPNPYPVPLILDERVNIYSAAGNEAATDPVTGAKFGFPGSASIGGAHPADSGGGIETHRVSERLLYTPAGDTDTVHDEASCFGGIPQNTTAYQTCSSSPSDMTNPFGTGALVVPANATPGGSFFSVDFDGLQARGSSNFSFDANTGTVSVIRSGYGTASGAISVRFMRADADLNGLLANQPAKFVISGGPSVELLVTNANGHRVGFNPPGTFTPVDGVTTLPGLLNATADEQPSVFAEIPGGSYSGIDSQTQVIEIPDPQPGSYQVQVSASSDPSFLLTAQTLDINGTVIDNQSASGALSAGGSTSFIFNVDEQGHVTMPGGTGVGTPPTTVASLSPQANGAGWENSNVTVTLTASASATGATVKQLSYSATGAQAIASATVSGGSATIVVSNEGVTTLNFFATDSAGNIETAKNVAIRLDKTPPPINCGAADGVWHAADVTIPCSASDAGSGLANASDASFPLSTSVPAGTETANAATGTHSVCDVAGNCATAGPITGNMVDRKPPSIVISSPASGSSYLLNQAVNANFSCTDGGSGVATCSGTVANGSPLDTATVGSKTFTVNAADNAGNVTLPQSVTYSVGYGVCLLYDPTRSVQSGSTIPLKIQLCDGNNTDVSSSTVVVHGVSLVQASTSASDVLQASGNANPDDDFRFDSTLGPTGGYIFNLSTKGLTTGSYVLTFTAGADPLPHVLSFQVR
ncbi:MAG TPA: hypothetical protein VGR55_08635 [Candidatus Acidoferrum sp.]|nr:hypothetical protein [Candidatus Acidoferrum sp.]